METLERAKRGTGRTVDQAVLYLIPGERRQSREAEFGAQSSPKSKVPPNVSPTPARKVPTTLSFPTSYS